jgi:hydrogenase maturation protein HypF
VVSTTSTPSGTVSASPGKSSEGNRRPPEQRLRVVVRGAVQGVGFRPFVYRLATSLGLNGWVLNSAQGVFIEVEGSGPELRDFLQRLESEKPAIASIQSLEASFLDPVGFTSFEIRESSGGAKTALILPDLATCPDCLREIFDPANRRHRYPFTNCTNCGPRFTIIESLPYDRPNTTMKIFTMCPDCHREYHSPADRRFHAQPNACPICGPHLALWDRGGSELATRDTALTAAAAAIRDGRIVAVKGLGGFHLIVDAGNVSAIRELRARKRREEKPFALMYPTLDAVLEDCCCSDIELRLLRSPESPIVLLRRKSQSAGTPPSGCPVGTCAYTESWVLRERRSCAWDQIAPHNPNVGVMLPYTPLHHLLMTELGFPVVATSGNLSDEPICIDEHEALDRLGAIADLFLVHNRPILRHVDDSVVREMAGRELVMRRARGFAPLPVQLDRTLDGHPGRPVEGSIASPTENAPCIIAVGPHQKNTIASSVGRQVFVSQHIGDLETAQSMLAFERVIQAFRGLYELKPAAIACDLHPDYLSTQYARSLGEPLVAVQHHYAHALACMAENQLDPPVLAITWDGSGFGPDQTIWGGEFLRITRLEAGDAGSPAGITEKGWSRFAHLRLFRLPGGERAVKEPRRVALSLLYETFGEAAYCTDAAPLRAFSNPELTLMRSMLARHLNSPLTSSAGRLFDAVASLAGLRQVCRFEGQAAMELEFAAQTVETDDAYPFELKETSGRFILDWEPLIRAIMDESETLAITARKFHNTLARTMAAVAERCGEPKVVLSGGCFQNRTLTETAIRQLRAAGFQPYWHQRIPPNDGGISLGQVVAATRELRRR